ncbi:MAG: L-seryl-tRNA(Sec) selenium transferase [Nitrospiraceae bacterium]|nr:MAG: L-seryl-tRNA(Sec) selenium transferase [Nitrospiraceae bacterium]
MVEKTVKSKQKELSKIPSVDEFLKSPHGVKLVDYYPRKLVLRAVRELLAKKREKILKNHLAGELTIDSLSKDIEWSLKELASYKLRPLINATGVVIHTNLGRSILSDEEIGNIKRVAGSYSNLEYELTKGKRGNRYSHIKDILRELSGAEDALVVNNNAAAVLLCLNTLAKDREVIVSRGELVEIGGSFRIPEVMSSSGSILREVGATNKTHLSDYENALSGNTALLLKVHPSNYKLIGFIEEVFIKELSRLGRTYRIPVMADLGSGCMVNLEKYGIYGEPTVQEVIKAGADIVTFSGDKLLGGPQAGIILGREKFIRKIQKNPFLRAVRIDKLTLASLEATLMKFLDEEQAVKEIPTLMMLTQPLEIIKGRAKKISLSLKRNVSDRAIVEILSDQSRAGGGSLPETDFPTFAVSVKPLHISVNTLEKKLRSGNPPVIVRVRENAVLIDARTVQDKEVKTLVQCLVSCFS